MCKRHLLCYYKKYSIDEVVFNENRLIALLIVDRGHHGSGSKTVARKSMVTGTGRRLILFCPEMEAERERTGLGVDCKPQSPFPVLCTPSVSKPPPPKGAITSPNSDINRGQVFTYMSL